MQLLSSGTCISVKVASFDSSEQIITMASECTEDFLLVAVWRVLETPTLSCSNELGVFERPQTISFNLVTCSLLQRRSQHPSLSGCFWDPCGLRGYLSIHFNTSVFPGAPGVPAACMGTSPSVSTPQPSGALGPLHGYLSIHLWVLLKDSLTVSNILASHAKLSVDSILRSILKGAGEGGKGNAHVYSSKGNDKISRWEMPPEPASYTWSSVDCGQPGDPFTPCQIWVFSLRSSQFWFLSLSPDFSLLLLTNFWGIVNSSI